MKIKKAICILSLIALSASLFSCEDYDSSYAEPSAAEITTAETTEAVTETVTTTEKATEAAAKPDKSKEKADFLDYITADSDNITPALWKATDKATGNELYLMGTIHVLPKCDVKFPDYINDVYENCDGVAVEYNPRKLTDMTILQEFLTNLTYTDGTTIKDHISEEAYNAGVKALTENNSYNSLLDYYMPGFWIDMISTFPMTSTENLSTDGVDVTFVAKAEKDGKEIIDIETLDVQVQAMNAYSDELASYVLASPQNSEDTLKTLGKLYDMWAEGDIDLMIGYEDEFEDDDLPEELVDDSEKYYDILLYDRNKGMADVAEQYLKEGKNYFFMVGSMHFAGDRGVDDLLAEKGYTVERIK